MELLKVELSGQAAQAETATGSGPYDLGLLGLAVHPKEIDGLDHTVVQLMFDDDRDGFDPSLIECPLVAEVRSETGDLVARELFDHDGFRRRLRADRQTEGDELRGVLVLTDGELPPPYLRLAFLPVPLAATAGHTLSVVRSARGELIDGIEAGFADGSLTDRQRRHLIVAIEQRHPE